MWTPKRIVLLTLGLILFIGAYLGYGRFLGSIDGLTPLPPEYYPPENGPQPGSSPSHAQEPTINERLQQAFGKECEELKWPIQLELKSRGLVMAAGDYIVKEGNTVELKPLSVAIFGKKNDGGFPEINTVRAKTAYLTFDGPVTNMFEMGKRKILECQLYDDITIVNNRHTPQRDDDMSLYIPHGPVYYVEAQHHMWTLREVELEDRHANEEPTKARATGMDVFLTPETKGQPAAPAAKAHGQAGVSGVDRVVLRSAVKMTLYVDGKSGFLASDRDKQEAPAPAKPETPAAPPKKAKVIIETEGPFAYDVAADRARFDIPVQDAMQPITVPQQVHVTRFQDEDLTKYDQLYCDHLELQFRRKTDPPPGQPASPPSKTKPAVAKGPAPAQDSGPGKDREIETVHAWGSEVIMTSDAEAFHASGIDFTHDARTHLNILKGDPKEGMFAIKDGNEIYAKEMRLLDVKEGIKTSTRVTAIGPGTIKTLDHESGKRPLEAHWKDTLVSSKDDDCDLIVLTGDAEFLDPQTDPPQRLQARILKVWLKSTEGKEQRPPVPKPSTARPDERQDHRLQRLEAEGNVTCDSRELLIRRSDHLFITFKDVPPDSLPPPTSEEKKNPTTPTPFPSGAPTVSGTAPQPSQSQDPQVPVPTISATGTAPPAAPAPEPPPPPRPIDLTARFVKATILRAGPRNVLDKLFCEGNVHVVQAPASKEDRGVDIQGATLDLTRKDLGNLLVVTGGDADLAVVLLDKICISGPEVNIDQAINKVWVDGNGYMEMLSTANFHGEQNKDKQPVPLVVYWEKCMLFNGQWAEFEGNVQAEQGHSRLLAEHLQVCLDRTVSLKEGHMPLGESEKKPGEKKAADKKPGEKEEPPPKVKTLVCSGKVHIEESTFENGVRIRYQRIRCPELSLDNEVETMDAYGPGMVHLIQPGDDNTGPGMGPTPPPPNKKAPPPPPLAGGPPAGQQPPGTKGAPPSVARAKSDEPVKAKNDQPMKLTRVYYQERMYGDNKRHLVTFTKNVEVFNLPGENPDVPLDKNRLPPGCMYMHSESLQVLQASGTKKQEMEATGRVTVMAQEFFGRADKVTYNENKEQVIFDGGENGLAELYKVRGVGLPPDSFRGKRIIYWRTTGAFEVDGARGAEGR